MSAFLEATQREGLLSRVFKSALDKSLKLYYLMTALLKLCLNMPYVAKLC